MSDIIISNVGPNISSQFDELIVSEKTPIVELTSAYGLSILRDSVTTIGDGTVTNDATEFNLSNTTNGIDSAILESVLRGRYEPGFAGEAGIGVRIPMLPIGNQIGRWGFFDDQNGAFLEWIAQMYSWPYGEEAPIQLFLKVHGMWTDWMVLD